MQLGPWTNDLLRRVEDALLAENVFPGLALALPEPRRPLDYPVRVAQVLECRLRRRNPPLPPWRRRSLERWQGVGPGPGPDGDQRQTPRLFAVAVVWNEEDVIFANVRNLFEQGADRVFVIDDDSDDSTVQEAQAAGGEVVPAKSDGAYNELERTTKYQRLIREETARAGGDVWWLLVDADEFPRGPGKATIREFIQTLPAWVDMVGSRVLDHWPSQPEAYKPRSHPLTAFPLAQWYSWPWCGLGHWKHQLVRMRTPDDLTSMPGHHTVSTADHRRAREYPVSLLMHHFAMRDLARTEAKLRRAWAPGGRYAQSPDSFTRWRIVQRLSSLNHAYVGRFELVPNNFPGQPRMGLQLRDWRELVPEDERSLPG